MTRTGRYSAARLPILLILSLVATVNAHSGHGNDLDSSMDMDMSLAGGHMVSWLHVTAGDVLWFQGWVPGKSSTLFGACVGLFVLGLLERWIAALSAALEVAIQKGT